MAEAEKEKKKNSFRDMILIIFVVLICFGLTIYGIVYLTGKVFSSEEKIEIAKIKQPAATTNPEDGDILTFSSKPETAVKETLNASDVPPAEPQTEQHQEKNQPKPTPIRTQQYLPDKQAPAAEPVKTEKNNKPATEEKPPVKQESTEKSAPQQPESTSPVKKGKGAYVVQIMSLKTYKDAEREAARFKSSCPDVFIQRADLSSKGIWYRVRCGATDSKEDAAGTVEMLKSKHKGIKPDIVSNK